MKDAIVIINYSVDLFGTMFVGDPGTRRVLDPFRSVL